MHSPERSTAALNTNRRRFCIRPDHNAAMQKQQKGGRFPVIVERRSRKRTPNPLQSPQDFLHRYATRKPTRAPKQSTQQTCPSRSPCSRRVDATAPATPLATMPIAKSAIVTGLCAKMAKPGFAEGILTRITAKLMGVVISSEIGVNTGPRRSSSASRAKRRYGN